MKNNHTTRPALPSLRPISCGILLALAGLPASPLMARDLNGEEETVTEADTPESWRLTNGARLEVTGGSTLGLVATDSRIRLDGATVARNGTDDWHALELRGSSTLTGDGNRIANGGILISDTSFAILRGTDIRIDADAPGFDRLSTIGITLLGATDGDRPRLTLSNSLITVVDNPAKDYFNSGIGISQGAGEVLLQQGTKIVADNVGVLLRGIGANTQPISLVLDNADIQTRHGPALHVAPGDTASRDYGLTVANGSTLRAGNGILLHVGGLPGSVATGQTTVRLNVDDSVLVGDVIFDPATVNGTLDVSLYNTAYVLGRFQDVNRVSVIGGARWHLTGDSRVRELWLNGTGSVKLGTGDGFNTLTVETFEGRQGTLIFNSVLGDDASLTDRLIITGDATGEAGVQVVNAGGQGAQTDQGIELIRIDGASDAEFELIGRAVGGQYEYALIKDANGNWYLRSQREEPELPHECAQNPQLPQCEITLPVEPIEPIDPEQPDPEHPDPENPDPEQPDPEEPGKPQPVLRPETGAYLANQAAMDQLLQHSAQTRMGHAGAKDGLRTWAGTEVAESRQALTGQQKLEATRQRLQVGADIGVFDGGQGRIGAMLGAGKAEATARSTVTGYRADGTVEGGSVGAYAHWSNDALYLDASVQHGRFRNTVHGEGLQAERYDSRAWQSAIEAGYRFNVGRVGGLALNLQPQLQLSYTDARTDQHLESNGTVVRSAGSSGLSTRLGLRLQGEAVNGGNHVAPYVAVNAYRDTRTAGVVFDGERIDGGMPRHRAELTAGGQLRLSSGLSAWGDVSAVRGEHRYRDLGARIGVNWRW